MSSSTSTAYTGKPLVLRTDEHENFRFGLQVSSAAKVPKANKIKFGSSKIPLLVVSNEHRVVERLLLVGWIETANDNVTKMCPHYWTNNTNPNREGAKKPRTTYTSSRSRSGPTTSSTTANGFDAPKGRVVVCYCAMTVSADDLYVEYLFNMGDDLGWPKAERTQFENTAFPSARVLMGRMVTVLATGEYKDRVPGLACSLKTPIHLRAEPISTVLGKNDAQGLVNMYKGVGFDTDENGIRSYDTDTGEKRYYANMSGAPWTVIGLTLDMDKRDFMHVDKLAPLCDEIRKEWSGSTRAVADRVLAKLNSVCPTRPSSYDDYDDLEVLGRRRPLPTPPSTKKRKFVLRLSSGVRLSVPDSSVQWAAEHEDDDFEDFDDTPLDVDVYPPRSQPDEDDDDDLIVDLNYIDRDREDGFDRM